MSRAELMAEFNAMMQKAKDEAKRVREEKAAKAAARALKEAPPPTKTEAGRQSRMGASAAAVPMTERTATGPHRAAAEISPERADKRRRVEEEDSGVFSEGHQDSSVHQMVLETFCATPSHIDITPSSSPTERPQVSVQSARAVANAHSRAHPIRVESEP